MTKNSTIGEIVYSEKRVAVELKSYIKNLFLQYAFGYSPITKT